MDERYQMDQWRLQQLTATLEQHADIMHAVARTARNKGTFPSNNALETELWPHYRNRISRDSFRYLCNDMRAMAELLPIGQKAIATGLDFEPLPDGNVLIKFFGDGCKAFNKQIVTAEVVRRMPFMAVAMT